MRTVIDLTEDDSPGGGPALPEPCSVGAEDDDVVISLRETELRMTFPQFCAYEQALSRYAFRLQRATGGQALVDLSDEDYYPGAEHQALRRIVVDLLGEAFDGAEVPAALRDRIRWRLAKDTDHGRWRSQEDRIEALARELAELRVRLVKPRRRPKEPR